MKEKLDQRHTRLSYRAHLQDPRWVELSAELIEKNGCCWQCGGRNNLQVHHLVYHEGRLPWDYDHCDLRVLCLECHKITHEIADQIWVECLRFDLTGLELILKRLQRTSSWEDDRKYQITQILELESKFSFANPESKTLA